MTPQFPRKYLKNSSSRSISLRRTGVAALAVMLLISSVVLASAV